MKRRDLIAGSALGLAVTPLRALASTTRPTPAQTAGPFYPGTLPSEYDNDLMRVAGAPRAARGTVMMLTGEVLEVSGAPVADALVEIWQCDAGGRYHHPRDRRAVAPDPGFQGYGQHRTGADGGYRFRTLRPVAYPGRTPHVHVAVRTPGRSFVTQIYIAGEAGNARDVLYGRLTPEERARLRVDLRPIPSQPDTVAARFRIVLPG